MFRIPLTMQVRQHIGSPIQAGVLVAILMMGGKAEWRGLSTMEKGMRFAKALAGYVVWFLRPDCRSKKSICVSNFDESPRYNGKTRAKSKHSYHGTILSLLYL